MPLYEYQCEACGQRFEVIQKFSDAPVSSCARCGKGPVRQLLSSPAIQFKGSGWYITDYAKKGKSADSSETGKSDSSKADATKTDGTKSDAPSPSGAAKTESSAPAAPSTSSKE